MYKANSKFGKLLCILCAVAFVCIGFAHKSPHVYAQTLSPSEVTLYTLPDGTSPVLCLPSDDGNSGDANHGLGTGCEACRLTTAILLPPQADNCGSLVPQRNAVVLPARHEASYRQLFPPNTAARAPPKFQSA